MRLASPAQNASGPARRPPAPTEPRAAPVEVVTVGPGEWPETAS